MQTSRDRKTFRSELKAPELSESKEVDEFRQRMVTLLDSAPECFHRHCFPGHFTGSALVVSADGAKALLNHHKFLDKWLQFGGHCDGDEDLVRVALREAEEETGISGLILASEKPFDLDIHPIPENPKRGEPAHFHYDVRYVLIAPEGAQAKCSEESVALQWFTPAEMGDLPLDDGLRRLLEKWKTLLRRRGHVV